MAWLTTVKHALPTVPCKNLLILGLSQTLWAHVAVENGSMGLKPAALRRDVRICDPLETRPRPTPYVLPCRIWSLWSNHMGVGKIWESQKFETLGTRRPNCVRWHDRPQRDHFSPPDVLFISYAACGRSMRYAGRTGALAYRLSRSLKVIGTDTDRSDT